ncbi:carboxypeptidase-like regulatory domain-containing protein [Gemmata sp. JC673]|uniref:Carboxypeptidase-like regulatory domain-containing protein n=1 Tax=Gemmata algarum TaxID=2975278 RepID=A0ABU5F2M5_9BACT|nr:hypothetical protein [Gemmata algarum]MDY3560114.1 carboxypeptidase-like regulatory domain-containing protein [Gemmata algarum]
MSARCFWGAASLVAFSLVLSGCSPAKGVVSGRVTHKGKPVTSGSVTLIASDDLPYAAQIASDGSYSIPGVPGGSVKIGVTSPNPSGAGRGGRGAAAALSEAPREGPGTAGAGSWVELPDKYTDPLKSGLSGAVSGDTRLDIDLP